MKDCTQEAHWRQQMMEYCERYGLTKTALRYRVSRKCVCKWRKRRDGTWKSLVNRSRRPHHSPRRQSEEEHKKVRWYGRKYRDDLLLGYQKACESGYSRSYGCFKHTVRRLLNTAGREEEIQSTET